MGLALGSQLGPYEILAPIGAGGMGEVWRARDTRLGRDVAIKVLPASFSADADRLARFEREARAVAALSHPNILSIHDFGTHDGVTYAAMELLEGETLGQVLAAGPISARRATDFALQIARGLAAAHEKGIVHRDLKPENLFVTADGRVKILDFGLARPAGDDRASTSESSPTVSALTEPGTVLGTVGYMSPEQVRGLPLDARSDIFSFGAVLYEMLSGRRAFQRETAAETMTEILRGDPSELSETGRPVSSALGRIVRHCLEKRPESRFQSAPDLAFALESVSDRSGPADPVAAAAAPGGRARRRIRPLVGILAAALAAAALAALWAVRERAAPEGPPTLRFTIAPPANTSFAGMVALSPDGSRLVFAASKADGRTSLWIRPLDAIEPRALDGTDGASFPFWSPDGRWLAFFAQGKLKKVDVSGGTPQTLCDAPGGRGGTWSPGGTILFSAFAGGEIDRVSESGGIPSALPHLVSDGKQLYRWPSFLPDGRHFLYFVLSPDEKVRGIHAGAVDSAEESRIAVGDAGAVYAAPGHILFRVGNRLMKAPFDADRRRVTGDASPLVEDVWWDGLSTLATAFSVSPNGVLVYQTGGLASTQLVWYDRSGRELGPAGPAGAYAEPVLSPDGRSLALTLGEPETGRVGIWVMDLARKSVAPVAVSSLWSVNATPLWSPDGGAIVYGTYPGGGVFRKAAHGGEKEKLLYSTPSFTPLDSFSPDGKLLFYDRMDWKTFSGDIAVRDLGAGESRVLFEAPASYESAAHLSPDGRWLAYTSTESGADEVFVRSFPVSSDRWQISAGGGTQPLWRGDGRELFFVSPDGKIMAAEIGTAPRFEAGAPHALFATRIRPLEEVRNNYEVTPDGQRFLVNSRRPEDASLPITVVAPWAPRPPRRGLVFR